MAGHRSTLKKANKAFKSAHHSSKRAIKASTKGKVEKTIANNKAIRIQSKQERKNYNKQLKKNKNDKVSQLQSLFNDSNKIERIITVLPLTKNISPNDIITSILKDEFDDLIVSANMDKDKDKIFEVKSKKFKSILKFIIPEMDNLLSILDSCKVSDFVIFGLSAIEEVDPNYGEQIIRSVEAQGISTTFAVLPDIVTNYPKKNLQLDVYKSLFSYYKHFFPEVDKLHILENKNDSSNLFRTLCQKIPKGIHWRDTRGYLIADHLDKFVSENDHAQYLTIEGIARGTGFNVNGLIHLPGFGDLQIEKLDKIEIRGNDTNIETFLPTEKESLNELQENEIEDLSMDEMDDDEEDESFDEDDLNDWDLVDKTINQKRRKLPKGMSEYQARWLKDEEIEAMIAEVGAQDENEKTGAAASENHDDINNMVENNDNNDGYSDEEVMEMDISPEEHERQLQEYRQREREELDFPDEIELRYDEIATERLSKYRGVKSLASSLWDYDELDERRPENWTEYMRIKNYKIYRNQILKKFKSATTVNAGDKIRITIKYIPLFDNIQNPKVKPFVVYSLLQNEHKLSVCNFSIQTWESYEEPIKSKESMVVQYGFRRYSINPLFSQHTRNANNVAKFQRFLHKGQVAVATAIVPLSLTNVPALFFRTDKDGSNMQILCQGTFENTDFTRILAKRVVLTGEVFKIHKSVVTIRFMFFNSDDVNAYKNVPLFSKMGRSGFIKESLGTHGDFKASFDGKLNQQDIIGMELFKRVWPKQGTLAPF